MKQARFLTHITLTLSIIILGFSTGGLAQYEASPIDGVKWQEGSSTADLGGIAQLWVPFGYVFADGDGARVLMEAAGNQPSNEEVGVLSPTAFDWFVVFEFSDIGYVKDDEKDDLDADAMLEVIRASTEQANEWRKERGFAPITLLGWEQKPHYNESTHNLEWATRGMQEAEITINHNTRFLGRKGIIKATLVVGSENLAHVLPGYREHLQSFAFQPGYRYAEFLQGDKIAKYGLTALVVGAGAAVAAKAGLFKYLWKILAGAGVAVPGFLKWIVGRRSSP